MNMSSIMSDSEILDELRARVAAGAHNPKFPIFDKQKACTDLDRIASGEELPADFGLEAIVLPVGRPALLIQNGTYATPTSNVWKARLESSRQLLESVIPSVGRIEVKNHPNYEWVGTGWVVADGVVVTNRHVAQEFSRKANGAIEFAVNHENRETRPRIDLREEYRQSDEIEFRVVRVLYIEESPGPDIAFLEVAFSGATPTPQPIPLASSVSAGANVAVIGYPAWDGRRNDPAVMKEVFDDIYDVKRLQPGTIVTEASEIITHDCSTLGGNSGSPLIDLTTGEAVGLHFSGHYLQKNKAVSAPVVHNRLANL